MKQTNNAIKFLMAQYRAIFKNAYFKGLTSAVLLTAGLAVAGGAQADALTDITKLTQGDKITITSTTGTNNYDNVYLINLTSGSYNLKGQLTVTSGSTGGNSGNNIIYLDENNTTATNLTGKDFSLIVNAASNAQAKDVQLGIMVNTKNDAADLNVDIGTIDIRKGSLELGMNGTAANQSGSLSVTADKITIGTNATISETAGTSDADHIAAKVVLASTINNNPAAGKPSGSGAITFGNAYTDAAGGNPAQSASVTTLNKSGIIQFLGDSGSANISKVVFAGQLVGKGGKLDFSSGSGQIEAYGTDVNANVVVGAGQTAQVLLSDKAVTKDIDEGLLQFTSGTIDVQGKGASAASSGGQILISGGTLAIEGTTVLTSSVSGDGAEAGFIKVSGTASNDAILRTSSQQLVEFLNSNEISKNTTDFAGALVVSGANSTLEFNDTATVDLYDLVTDDPNNDTDLTITKITNDGNVSGGALSVSGGTIKATNLAVSNYSTNLVLDKAFLEADNLTLGSADYDETSKITISGSTVHNSLTLLAKDDTFDLTSGTHTLKADYYDSQNDPVTGNWLSNTVAAPHYIKGDAVTLS